VLEAIGRALGLDAAERVHLNTLAGVDVAGAGTARPGCGRRL
jgi:hypothetical protein